MVKIQSFKTVKKTGEVLCCRCQVYLVIEAITIMNVSNYSSKYIVHDQKRLRAEAILKAYYVYKKQQY